MIYNVQRNLLESHCQVLIHGCNCVGVMGRGVAKALVTQYPEILSPYQKACGNYSFRPGLIQPIKCNDNRIVINCATQMLIAKHRNDVVADAASVSMCLSKVIRFIKQKGINQFASPKIGSGLGGLNWSRDVFPIFEKLANNHPDIDIFIHSI